MRTIRLGRQHILGMLPALLGLTSSCSAGDEIPTEPLASTASALTVAQKQTAMNSFYDMNNVVSVHIMMTRKEWTDLTLEQPVGGSCFNRTAPGTDRFAAHHPDSVTITGTPFPIAAQVFGAGDVEMKKKSYCGSFTDDTHQPTNRPSFKLKLPPSAEDALGTRYLVFNNSKQDPSYVRQCLGYKLFGMAGLPHARCNFVQVTVTGSDDASQLASNVWVNVEPIRERFIDNPDNQFTNTSGSNLYELESPDDLIATRLPYMEPETISKFGDMRDLIAAFTEINNNQVTGMRDVFDVDQFIKIYAMESLLKSWDGYSGDVNNTYLYNDVAAVALPQSHQTPPQVRFKLIPFGLDLILNPGPGDKPAQPNEPPPVDFDIRTYGVLAKLARNDSALFAQLKNQIQTYRSTVFGRGSITGELKTFLDLMTSKLQNMGVNASVIAHIPEVRAQLKLVRSAGLYWGGFTSTTGLNVIERNPRGDALHASVSQGIPAGATNPTAYEVVHKAQDDSAQQHWYFQPSTLASYSVVNQNSGWWLNSSSLMFTPANHPYVFISSVSQPGNQDYWLNFEHSGGPDGLTGYFTMVNQSTGGYLNFGTDDPTPGTGALRAYQTDSTGYSTLFYWY